MEENIMSDKVERSIYFYEFFSFDKNNDKIQAKESGSIVRFFHKLLEDQKNSESFKNFAVHMLQGEEFIIVDEESDEFIKFRIVLCKENALPYIENNGKLENLESYIDADKNIAEVTHCILFKNYCILGAEFNFSGARATSIPEYIAKRTEGDLITQCHAKLNYNAYQKLIEEETFTLFDFTVATNSEAYMKVLSNKSIFSAIQAAVPESDTMEVVIKKKKTKRNFNSGFTLPISFTEIKDLLQNYREDIKKLNVSQGNYSEKIDLLADKFVGKAFLAKTKDRVIDQNEMYASIINFFNSDVKQYCKKWEE